MHSFQPLDLKDLEINPFQMIGEDWMLVTAGNEEKANTMTASWGGLGVIWGKKVVSVFIRESRYTKEFIDREQKFSLSFPGKSHRREMKFLGAVSGRTEDKITEAGVHLAYMDGIPYIDEGKLIIICRCLSKTKIEETDFLDEGIGKSFYADGDFHTMYIAEILGAYAR